MTTHLASVARTSALAIALLAPWLAFAAQISPDYAPRQATRDWVAEVSAAEAELIAARAERSIDAIRVERALGRLGDAELGLEDFAAAEKTFRDLLDAIGARVIPAAPDFVAPLNGLGRALVGGGHYDTAAPVFERGMQIARRGFGLFAPEQEPSLLGLAMSLRAIGKGAEADQLMLYTLYIAERQYGEGDPRVVPAFSRLTEWFLDGREVGRARATAQLALNIVDKDRKQPSQDVAVVVPLALLARSYMVQVSDSVSRTGLHDSNGMMRDNEIDPRRMVPSGERALERALDILDAKPDAPKDLVIEVLVQTGDWFGIRQQPAKALTYYKRAAALLAQLPDTHDAGPLSFPVCIYYRAPKLALRNLDAPDASVFQQSAEVIFDVEPDGSVDTARLKTHDAARRVANDVLGAVRESRYRPRFENGEPVLTQALTYRETFRFLKSDEE
jgi:hypothetical protein